MSSNEPYFNRVPRYRVSRMIIDATIRATISSRSSLSPRRALIYSINKQFRSRPSDQAREFSSAEYLESDGNRRGRRRFSRIELEPNLAPHCRPLLRFKLMLKHRIDYASNVKWRRLLAFGKRTRLKDTFQFACFIYE